MEAWFDSHCHLYEVDDPGAAIEAARSAGVVGMLIVGVDQTSSEACVDIAAGRNAVWAAAACHPSEAKGWDDARAFRIENLLHHPSVVAVGETGLDFYWDESFIEDQKRAFTAHIELAKRHRKALVIHTRDSLDAALELLREEGPPERFVFHCWSGTQPQLEAALSLGAYVSFAGNISFKNARALRALAPAVPADRLLIETDSPYLSPEPHRGRPNTPANLPSVGRAVAAARGVEPGELAQATTQNACRLLAVEPAELCALPS